MEHCVEGKEKYLASGSGLFGRSTRKNPFEALATGWFCIFFASQLMHKLKQLKPFKRYSLAMIFMASAMFGFHVSDAHAAACTASATGNWSNPATWGGTCNSNQYPGVGAAGDSVVVNTGVVVTLDVTPASSLSTITINDAVNAANGITFGTNRTLTTTGAVTITAGTGTASSTIAVGASTNTLDANSIAIGGGSSSGSSVLSASTGTITTAGGITFSGTAARAQLTTTGAATINLTGTISSGGTLSINAATNMVSTGTSAINGAYTVGILTVSSGTMTLGANLITLGASTSAVNVSGGTLNNGGFSITGNGATDTFTVANGAFFELGGASSSTPTSFTTVTYGATSTVRFLQTSSGTITAATYGNLELGTTADANTVTYTLSSTATVAGTLTIGNASSTGAGDTLLQGSSNLTTGAVTVTSKGTWSNTSIGDIVLSGDVVNNGTIILNSMNGYECTNVTDDIVITSSVNNTTRAWSGSGTFTIYNVNADDMTGAGVTAYTSTLSGDTTWTAGACNITISGTVYSDEGTTTMVGTQTVSIKVNGSGTYTTTLSTGAYSIANVSAGTGSVITVFLDGATEKAAAVTRSVNGSTNITGLNLYQNRVIVRSEDAGPLTNANMDFYDSVNDADIQFTVTTGALTVITANTLYVMGGSTVFTPGGTVTANGGFKQVGGTFNGGSNTIDINGAFSLTGGTHSATTGTFTNSADFTISGGTFTHNSGTVTLDVNATRALNTGSAILNNLTINASNSTFTVTGTVDVNGNLVLTNAASISGGTIAVGGASVTTTDTSITGTTVISFDGTGAQTLTVNGAGGSGDVPGIKVDKASNTLTIQDTIGLNAGGWTWVQGTVSTGTSTLVLEATNTIDAGSTSFNNLTISSAGTLTITGTTLDVDGNLSITTAVALNGGTITVGGNVTTTDTGIAGTTMITFNGTGAQTLSVNGAGGSGDLPALVTVDKASGTLTLQDTIDINTGGWTWTQGTVDPGTSTINFTGSPTINSGSMSFNNVNFNGTTFTITGTMDVNANMTLTAATTINGAITIGGNLTALDAGIAGTTSFTLDGTGAQTLGANATGAGRDIPGPVTINKASGTLTLQDNLDIIGSWTWTQGTVDPGTSTMTFVAGTYTINSGSMSFNDVVFSGAGTDTITGTMDINGAVTFSSLVALNGGTLTVGGNVTATDTAVSGTTALTLDGTGAQTITATGGTGDLPNGTFTINKASGTATLTTNLTLPLSSQAMVIAQGTFDTGGFTLTGGGATSALTVSNGATFVMSGASAYPASFTGGTTYGATSNTKYNQNTAISIGNDNYGNLELAPSANTITFTLPASASIWVQGNYTLGNGTNTAAVITGATNNPVITVEGSMTVAANTTYITGTGALNLKGTSAPLSVTGTFTPTTNGTVNFQGASATNIPGMTFHNLGIGTLSDFNSVTYSLTGALTVNGTLTIGQSSTSIQDTFSQGTYSVTAGAVTVTSRATWSNISTGDIVLGGNVTNSGAIILNSNNSTKCTDGADDIVITSSSGGTQRTWSGTGTFTLYNVNATDQIGTLSSGSAIPAYYSTLSNSGWASAVCGSATVSGVIYNSSYALYDCSANNLTVAVKVNGAGSYSATCTASTGAYSISSVTVSSGDVVTIYLDGETPKATEVVKSDGTYILIDLWENYVEISSMDGSAVTNTNLNQYDNACNAGTGDSDILFCVDGGNLTLSDVATLNIFGATTFTPGGSVTTDPRATANDDDGAVYVGANCTLNMGANALSIGGTLWISSTGGAFTVSSGQTTTFTGTVSGMYIDGDDDGILDLENLVFNGTGGTWIFYSYATINGDLTMTAGTLSPDYVDITTKGHVTGNGVISGGLSNFIVDGTKNFGGNGAWTFDDLTFGDGTGTETTTATGSGSISVDNILTIAANQTLDAGSQTFILRGYNATPFVKTGTFTANTSTFNFDGPSDTITSYSIPAYTYYNLGLGTTSDAYLSDTFSLSGATTVGGTLTIGNASSTNADTFDQGASYDLITGAVTVTSKGLWKNLGTGDITLSGNVSNAGTITLSGSGISCGGADAIALTSSNTTRRVWSGAGTFTLTDLTVSYMEHASSLTALSSTDGAPGGTNLNWTIAATCNGINVSGRVFTNEGSTGLDCSSSKTIGVIVNGEEYYTAECSNSPSNGSFTVSDVPISAAGQPLVVYLDGETEKASTVTRAVNGSTNITGLDLYQNRVIVRHEDSGPLTSTNIDNAGDNTCNSGWGDTDIQFCADAGRLSISSGNKLIVWTGKTFTPGGGVVTYPSANSANPDGDVLIQSSATLSMGANPLSVGGDFTNSGTYTISSGQETGFTATTSGHVIDIGTGGVKNLLIEGVGGYSFNDASNTIDENLTIKAGTLTASSALTVVGNFENRGGTFTHNSGTLTLTSGSGSTILNPGGSSLYNLILNNASGTWSLSGDLTIANDLTVTAGTLTGSGNLTVNGGDITGNGSIVLSGSNTYLYGMSQMEGGGRHTCGISTSGKAYCWGQDGYGELGNGAISGNQSTPTIVEDGAATGNDTDGTYLTNVKNISGGGYTSCAVTTSGKAYCWGDAADGTLGDGQSVTVRTTPVLVLKGAATGSDTDGTNLANMKAVTVGFNHACALSNSGKVYCWGDDSSSQLGNSSSGASSTPVLVEAGVATGPDTDGTYLANIKQIDTGLYQTCALSNSGKMYCWGNGFYGGLGRGSTANASTPVLVLKGAATGSDTDGTYLINMKSIHTGGNGLSCAISNNSGKTYCWGQAADGALGDGQTSTNRTTPILVLKGEATGSDTDGTYLTNIKSMALDQEHTCAVSNSGKMYCWGNSLYGKIGGTGTYSTPVLVEAGAATGSDSDGTYLVNVKDIGVSAFASCALTSSGKTYCWGYTGFGQVGDGQTTSNRSTPVFVQDGNTTHNPTTLLDGAGNFSGNTAWSFYSLTFGDGTGTTTSTATGSGGITADGVLTIAANQTFDAASKTLTLAGAGTPFVVTGTFTPSTSTMNYIGSSATTVAGATYYNLGAGTTSDAAAAVTYTLGANTTVQAVLTVGNSGSTNTDVLSGSSYTLDLQGASTPLNITSKGSFAASTSTVNYNGQSSTTIAGVTYNNLGVGTTLDTSAAVTYTLGANTTVGEVLTIGNASSTNTDILDASTRTLYLNCSTTTTPFSITAKGSFTPSTSTVVYVDLNGGHNVNVAGISYYSLGIGSNSDVFSASTFTLAGNISVSNVLTIGSVGSINSDILDASSRTIDLTGGGTPLVITSKGTFTASTSTVKFNGQSATNVPAATYNALEIGTTSDSSTAVTYSLTGNITSGGGLTIGNASSTNNDVLSQGTYNITSGAVTVTSKGTWSNLSTGDITLSGGVANAGIITLNSNNGTQCVDGADDIVITSSASPTQRTWSGAGTFTIYNVSATDQAGTITVYTSALSNTTWSQGCGITISGTVYSDEGTTTMTGTPAVRIKVNGAGSYTANASSGAYSIPNITIGAGGDVVTVFLDTNGGNKAVTITRAADTSSNITGFNLYQDRVIVRHEDAGPITNTNLDQYDSVGDSDIPFTVTTSNLATADGAKLIIWTGKTFTPGGTVTTDPSASAASVDGDLTIQASATLSMGANDLSIGGDYLNSGTFSYGATQNTMFTATTTGHTINDGASNFSGLYLYGSAGTSGWTLASNVDLQRSSASSIEITGTLDTGGFTLTGAGTTDGFDLNANSTLIMSGASPFPSNFSSYNIMTTSTVKYNQNTATTITNATYGNLELAPSANSTTFTLPATVTNIPGNLTIGNGTNTAVVVTGATNNPSFAVAGNMTVAANTTYTTGTGTLTLSGSGTPLSVTGTFTASASNTVNFTGTSATNIPGLTYVNLGAGTTSDGGAATTYTLTGNSVVTGVLTVGNAGSTNTDILDGSSRTMDLQGSGTPLVITSKGSFTASTSTVNYNGQSATNVALATYNNLGVGTTSDASVAVTYTLAGNTTVSGVFTLGNAASTNSDILDGSSRTLTLTGSGTPLVITSKGTFTASTSTVQYMGTSGTNIAGAVYNILEMKPASGSPTYELGTGASQTVNTTNMTIGDGTNAVTVSRTSFDPTIYISTTMTVNANATYSGSGVIKTEIGDNLTVNGIINLTNPTGRLQLSNTGTLQGSGSITTDSFRFGNNSGTNNTTISGSLTISAGAFSISDNHTLNAGSQTITITGSGNPWSRAALNGGTFNAQTSTINYTGTSATTPQNETYYNLGLGTSSDAGAAVTYSLQGATTVTNVLTVGNASSTNTDIFDGASYTLTLSGSGTPLNITSKGSFTASTSTINYTGSSATNITAATYNILGVGTDNSGAAAGVTYTLAGNITSAGLTIGNALSTNNDVLSQGAYTITANGTTAITVTAKGTWSNLSTGDIVLGGNVANAGVITLNSNNGTQCTDAADDIVITSSVGATQRTWSGAGTFTLINLNVTDMAGSVTAYTSTFSNTAWTVGSCGITISGTVYTDEGTTVMATGPSVVIKVNGAGTYSATANGSGVYSIPSVTIASTGDVVTVFLDTNGGNKAVTVTRAADTSSNITSFNLYQDRVIVRHEDAGPVTNTNLDQYDNGNDTDIPFTVTTGALTVDAGTKLIVWTGKSFTPGGTVTTTPASVGANPDGDLTIQSSATLSMAANALSVGGDFLNSGAYSYSAGQLVTFTGSSDSFSVNDGTSNFAAVTFDSAAQAAIWTLGSDLSPTGDVTVTDGTLNNGGFAITGASTKTFSLNLSTFAMTGTSAYPTGFTTYTYAATSTVSYRQTNGPTVTNATYGNLELAPANGTPIVLPATLNNLAGQLNIGNGTNAGATASANNPSFAATGLYISPGATYVTGTGTLTLTGGFTPLQVNGTFTATAGSTVNFTNTAGNATVAAVTYYNLGVGTTSDSNAARTFTFASGTVNVLNNLTVGNASSTNSDILQVTTNDPVLDVNNDVIITSKGTVQASNSAAFTIGGNYSNSGLFTNNSGTVTFDATDTGNTINGTLSGTSDFSKVVFNGSGGEWTLGANLETDGASATAISVAAGTLKNGGFSITGNGATDTFSVSNGAFFEMSGTSAYPASFTTYTYPINSTVVYRQTNGPTVTNATYGNLNLYPANATPIVLPATLDGVVSGLRIGDGTNAGATASANNPSFSVGYMTVSANSTYVTGSGTLTITTGNTSLSVGGTFTASAGNTVNYTATSATNIAGLTYQNLGVGTTSDGGAAATYTLAGNATVAGVLTIGNASSTNTDIFDLTTRTLTLSGSGTPLVITSKGSVDPTTSTTIYTGTGATNIAASTYYNLYLQPPSGSPTYTLGTAGSQTIQANNSLILGDGTNAVTVSNTTWSPSFKAMGAFTVSANATLSGSGTTTVDVGVTAGTAGSLTFDGTVNLTNCTLKMDGDRNIAGNGSVTAYKLQFGNTIGTQALTSTGSGAFTALNEIAINSDMTLNAGSRTYTAGGAVLGTPFMVNGTFNAQTSTFNYTGQSATTVTGATYNNLGVGTTSDASAAVTYTLGANTNVSGVLTIGNATSTNSDILDASSRTIDLTGSGTPLVITSKGTFTAGTSTVKFNGQGATTVPSLTYNNVEIGTTSDATPGRTYTLAGDVTIAGVLTLGNASSTNDDVLALSDKILTFTGSGTPFVDTTGADLDRGTSTVNYIGSSATTVEGVDYYNLTVGGTSDAGAGVTYSLGGFTRVYNVLTVGNAASTNTDVLNGANRTLNLYAAGTSFVLTSKGSFTAGTSSVVYHAQAATDITALTYYDLSLGTTSDTGAGGVYSLTGGTTVSNALVIGNAGSTNNDTLSQGTHTLTTGAVTVTAKGIWSNISTGDIVLSGNVANAGVIILNSNNGTQCVDGTDDIVITSSVGATQRDWTGAGTFTIYNVSVTDMQSTTAVVTAYTSAFSNTTWTVGACGITISGTVYSDEGTTTMVGTQTLRIKVNGAGTYSTTLSSGTFSVSSITIASAGDVITAFLDGATEKGVTVTRAANTSSNITGLNLYQNRVIIRHEDAGPMTNTNLNQYDNTCNSGTGDTDVQYCLQGGNLTVEDGAKLIIWTGKTFTPGGTVATTATYDSALTTGDLTIQSGATLSMGTNALSVGGDFLNSGTYSYSAGQNTTFTANGAGFSVEDGTSNFSVLTFNGNQGIWTLGSNVDLQGASTTSLNITLGTLNTGGFTITGAGTTDTLNISNNGTLIMSGTSPYPASFTTYTYSATSTVRYAQTNGPTVTNATYGHLELMPANATAIVLPATLNNIAGNLTIGDGTNAGATGAANDPSFAVAGIVTVAANATYTTGQGILTLSGSGTPLVVNGSFSQTATGTVNYTGSSATNVAGAQYGNLGVGTTSDAGAAVTYTLAGNTTLQSVLTIGNASSTNTDILNASSRTLDLRGSGTVLVITSKGSFTASTSTVNYTDTSAVAVNVTGTTYNNLGIGTTSDANAGKTFTLAGNATVGGVLTIGNATSTNNDIFNLSSRTLELTGSGTPVAITTKGTLTASTSTVNYNGQALTTVAGITYFTLGLGTTSDASAGVTYELGGNVTIDNLLTVGNAASTNTDSLDGKTRTLTIGVTGTPFVITSKGAFIPSTSNVSYQYGATVTGATYYDVGVGIQSDANPGRTFPLGGNVTVQNVFTVGNATSTNADTLEGGSYTLDFTGSGTPFNVTSKGIFSAMTSTVNFTGAAATTIPTMTYYNLGMGTTPDANAVTYTVASGTLTVLNDVTMGNPSTAADDGIQFNTNDPIVDVNGNVLITAYGVLNASNSAAFTIGGNWTDNNPSGFRDNGGTVTFDATTTGKTLNGNMSGVNTDFYRLVFAGTGGEWTLGANLVVAGASVTALDIQAGTLKNGGFSITGNGATDTFNVANGAFFEMSGTSAHPASFTNITYGGSSTVRYLQTNGPTVTNVTSGTFGNLELKPANSTPIVLPAALNQVDGGITIGDGTNAGVTGAANNPSYTIFGVITINANATYVTGSGTITIRNNSGPVGAGTFTASTGNTVNYTANGGVTTVSATTFYNLGVGVSGTGTSSSLTYRGPSGTVHVLNNLTVGHAHADADVHTFNLLINGATLDVDGSVSVTSKGILLADDNLAFTVGGNFSVASGGTFTHSNGTVTLDGAGAQTISGSSTFYNLVASAAAARTLSFEAASTTSIASGGSVSFTGASGQLLTLASTTPGTEWNLQANNAIASQTIQYVNVSDCNAGPFGTYAEMIANDGTSADGGNNSNWDFGTKANAFLTWF